VYDLLIPYIYSDLLVYPRNGLTIELVNLVMRSWASLCSTQCYECPSKPIIRSAWPFS